MEIKLKFWCNGGDTEEIVYVEIEENPNKTEEAQITEAFHKWLNNNDTYGIVADAIEAYTKFLQQKYFKTKDTVVKMNYDLIKKLTDEDLFIAIPEILMLNTMKPDFIDLGSLSRNVFYHILREQITQPL